MDAGESVTGQIDDEQLLEAIEGGAIELDDLGVDDADRLELTKAEFAQSVWSQPDVPGVLDLQMGDARAEALVVQQFAASVIDSILLHRFQIKRSFNKSV